MSDADPRLPFGLGKFRRARKTARPSFEGMARDASVGNVPVFCIVTPVFNGSVYIDDTIQSVLSQSGDFAVHYHVQDGGSTDDTMDRVRRWMKLSGELPRGCRKLHFTCASEPDTGMYDAINRGFARSLPPGDDVVMGWIAADDRIAPGAFATIAGIRAEFADVRFLGGRVSLLEETGSIISVEPVYPYSRRCMAAGLYDGRALPFVMQEGSFWCADLWRRIGGLDPRFRLAGDWDLWRRMAAHEPYFMVDGVLGFHRRRPGQLSEHLGSYYAEVDRFLADAPPAERPEILDDDNGRFEPSATYRTIYDRIAVEHEAMKYDALRFRASPHAATVLRYSLAGRLWERRSGFGAAPVAPDLMTVSGPAASKTILLTTGLHPPEGPYPEIGLLAPVRWMSGPLTEGEVEIDRPGQYRIIFRCRNRIPNQGVTILADGRPLARLQVTAHGYDRDIALTATGTFTPGRHVIAISAERPVAVDRYLLLIDAVIEQLPGWDPNAVLPISALPIPLAMQAGDPPEARWPTMSIVVETRHQGNLLRDTLDSIIHQAYPRLELIVVDDRSHDETAILLREYGRHLTCLIVAEDEGIGSAIDRGLRAATGEVLGRLNAGDLLAEGALHAIAHAFLTSDADIVAGVADLIDDRNVTMQRTMPRLNEGSLVLFELLDVEDPRLRGGLLHAPEIFVRRHAWQRTDDTTAGTAGSVPAGIANYDRWIKLAEAGAVVHTIASTIAHVRPPSPSPAFVPSTEQAALVAHAVALRIRHGLPSSSRPTALPDRLRIVLFNDHGFGGEEGVAFRRLGTALAAAGHDVTALAVADPRRTSSNPMPTASQAAAAILERRPDLVLIGNIEAARCIDVSSILLHSGVPIVRYAHGPAATPELGRSLAGNADDPRHDGPRRVVVLTSNAYTRRALLGAAGTSRVAAHVAPIGIDTAVFCRGDRWRARMLLDLPQDAFIVIAAGPGGSGAGSDGLRHVVAALELLPDQPGLLLLLLGSAGLSSHMGVETRQSGEIHDDDVLALHYQAADLHIGHGLGCARTYAEAAACGVPSIAYAGSAGSEVILPDFTGLLVPEHSPEVLSAAVARLRADASLRRRMGVQAHLRAGNEFSVAASAVRLTGILANDSTLALSVVPAVTPVGDMPGTIHLEYIVKPDDAPPSLPVHWIAASGLIEDAAAPGSAGSEVYHWLALSPCCRFMVRGEQDCPHILTMRAEPMSAGCIILASVNCETEQSIPVSADQAGPQILQVPLQLMRGLNRVDLRFPSPMPRSAQEGVPALRIEDIRVRPGAPLRGKAPPDGSFDLISGFDFEEGPYPEWGLPDAFSWALGRQSKVRVYSASSGRRRCQLRIRNGQPDQRLTIRVDSIVMFSDMLDAEAVEFPLTIAFDVDADPGFHVVLIETTRQAKSDTDPRRMAFIFEGLDLEAPGRPTADGR